MWIIHFSNMIFWCDKKGHIFWINYKVNIVSVLDGSSYAWGESVINTVCADILTIRD